MTVEGELADNHAMDPISILYFLLVGGVAGWLAGMIMKTPNANVTRNIIIGMIGALIGGLVFPALGVRFSGLIGEIIMATGGAAILLFFLTRA